MRRAPPLSYRLRPRRLARAIASHLGHLARVLRRLLAQWRSRRSKPDEIGTP